jgi:hypothetical protein
MVDTCTITRVVSSTTDVDSGEVDETLETVYTGRCRIQQPPAIARPADVGQALVFQLPSQLQLPMAGSEGVEVGDRVTIDASVDDDLVDRTWWVKALFHKTHATSRRIGLEEVTS